MFELQRQQAARLAAEPAKAPNSKVAKTASAKTKAKAPTA
jgi:hypothetical protein